MVSLIKLPATLADDTAAWLMPDPTLRLLLDAPGLHAAPIHAAPIHAAPVPALPAAARYVSATSGVAVLTAQAPLPTQVTVAGSSLVINLDWDSSVANAPAGFKTDVIAAATFLATQFVDAVTITLNVGYDEVGGQSLGSTDLGESLSNLTSVSYASLLAAVTQNATTATDAGVVASLPASSPVHSANYWVTSAQAKALGLAAANGTSVDGSIGFGLASQFSYGDTNAGGTVAAGTYDFFATVVHEMTEVMGRQMMVGATESGTPRSYTLLDLLHWSAAGTRDFTQTTAGYFSTDGGVTNLGAFNTIIGGDSGDWASSVSDDSFDAYAVSGVTETVSANDLTEMDALGWEPSGSSNGQSPVSAPSGMSIAVATDFLAGAQVNKGLAGRTLMADITQTGGLSGDGFRYVLSGAGAAAFTLASASNVATLSVGAAAIAGAGNGKDYALDVTITDLVSGGASPALPLNVVVGGNGNDAITVASLSGIVATAPTFIYGLGGIDTINGTGMSGTLYFVSGSGADTLTGGSGINVYEYGAPADSTASAMDIITNFNVALDVIDLTGIGATFSTVAALAGNATTVAGETIGWKVSGGNTFVYANINNRAEALGSANMTIELKGDIALTSANFTHV